ncbi:MAG: hypothetical protein Aurels2KO_50200 [Aureliella sp.]
MVDFETEEQLNGRTSVGPLRGMAGNVAGIASDAVTLTELQVQLAQADFAEVAERTKIPLAIAAIGGSLVFGSMPVLAFGLASLLASSAGMSAWAAQLIVGSVLMAVAIVSITVAATKLTQASKPLHRSAQEFRNNLTWLKAAVGQTDRNG